jgi:hypothetical protein
MRNAYRTLDRKLEGKRPLLQYQYINCEGNVPGYTIKAHRSGSMAPLILNLSTVWR